ncbi:MAG: CotH kinase family protein [Verrucomicrobia bacterium]|nr:CotH kinase family protein [Verrucomicrobiota bacterium]
MKRTIEIQRWAAVLKTGVLLLTALLRFGPPAGAAEASGKANTPPHETDASDEFFARGPIPFLKIQVTGTNLETLLREPRQYVRATVSDGTNVYREVGLHLKGAAGSFRDFHDKPALTLNFDKFKPGQKFHGVEKLHLNNSVQDPSYVSEHVCGAIFREADIPTPRAAWARVELNGRDRGLYVLKEGFDSSFLRRHFKDTSGNLYDGEFVREITEPLRRDSGTGPSDHSDLRALVSAAEEPDPARRLARLEKVLNLEQFLTYLALETLMWDWDGYPMNHNNYRVYFEPPSGRAVFLPHGMDQMFGEPHGSIYPPLNGLLARAVIETPAGRERYRARLRDLPESLCTAAKLTNLVAAAQARLRAALARLDPREAGEIESMAEDLKLRIVERLASVRRQLEDEPKPLAFDGDGVALLRGWQARDETGVARQEKISSGDRAILRIRMNAPGVASWRTRVPLGAGTYRFEGRAKTAAVRAIRDEKGEGAGLRISGSQEPRENGLAGDTDWRKLSYRFRVEEALREIELVAELRAHSGEARFDEDALKLVRE